MEPPHKGDVISIGAKPEPCGLHPVGVVQDSGVHGDGRIWARVWHLVDGYSPVMSVVEFDVDHWRFESRAFDRLDPSVRATIEYQIAMHHKFRPRA